MKQYALRILGLAFAFAYFAHAAFTPSEWHFIDNVNLIFHEAGHTIFMFFGEFIHVLMGSGFQVLLPLSIALYFWYTGQRISSGITLMWAGQSLVNVSVYASDAVAMQLPLLGGDSVHHDWNYLLTATHLLSHTPQVASALYALGCLLIFGGALVGAVYLKRD